MGRVLAVLVLLAVTGSFMVGCGGGPKLPPLAPASGVVTLDGAPLAGASLQFQPVAGKGAAGPTGVAFTDDKGHFEVTTATVKGAVVGSHRIAVTARKPPKNEKDTLPPSLIPERYNNAATSKLTAEVKAGDKNEINLALQSK
jgi:hypothetical protein